MKRGKKFWDSLQGGEREVWREGGMEMARGMLEASTGWMGNVS